MSARLLFHMHGAARHVSPDATAFAARRDQWDIDILTQWVDITEAERHVASARAYWDAIVSFSEGVST